MLLADDRIFTILNIFIFPYVSINGYKCVYISPYPYMIDNRYSTNNIQNSGSPMVFDSFIKPCQTKNKHIKLFHRVS